MNENGTVVFVPPHHGIFIFPIPVNEPDSEE